MPLSAAQKAELARRKSLPLPPELIGECFAFYVHLYRQLPEKLLLVCRTWHVLAILWTNLDPLEQFSFVIAIVGKYLSSISHRSLELRSLEG